MSTIFGGSLGIISVRFGIIKSYLAWKGCGGRHMVLFLYVLSVQSFLPDEVIFMISTCKLNLDNPAMLFIGNANESIKFDCLLLIHYWLLN